MYEIEEQSPDQRLAAQRRMRMPDLSDRDDISFPEIRRTLYKRKLVIAIVATLVFAAVAIGTFLKAPVYESVSRLQIDPDRSSNLGLEDLLNDKFSSEDTDSRVATEVKIIQSDTIAEQVIKSLSLSKEPAFTGKNAAYDGVTDPAAMSPAQRQTIVSAFQGDLNVRSIPNTRIVEVRFQSTNPKLATDINNAVVRAYIERAFKTRYEGTAQVSQWLGQQMQELKSGTVEAQQKLADFQKQNGILGADENNNITLDRLKQLNEQLTDAEADRIVKEARYRLASSGDPESVASVSPNPTLQVLRTQEADLRAQLAQLNAKYGNGYPKVRELQSQLAELQLSIKAEIRNVGKRLQDEYRASSKAEAMLRGQFNEQKNQAYQLNEHVAQYAILKHEVESSSTLYDTLQLKLREAGVTAGLSSSYITVIDKAAIPATPIAPRKKLNLALGLLGGLFGGCLLAFVLESLDDTLSSSEEVEQISSLPVLGSVPLESQSAVQRKNSKFAEITEQEQGVQMLTAPRSAVAEAYRSLRTALLLSSPDRQPKVLVVTSSIPNEGKTTVSLNLAVAFAQRGEKVLLIDADLRRSSIHSRLNLPRSDKGLSTILANGVEEGAMLAPLADVPNLSVIPAGPHPPNPAEALASNRMADCIAQWAEQFDRIIIDTPPVLAVADALSLAVRADGVVLVVRSGESRKKAVLRVRDLVQRSNGNILGFVLNAVNLHLEHYYYSYGNGYKSRAGYYEGEEN